METKQASPEATRALHCHCPGSRALPGGHCVCGRAGSEAQTVSQWGSAHQSFCRAGMGTWHRRRRAQNPNTQRGMKPSSSRLSPAAWPLGLCTCMDAASFPSSAPLRPPGCPRVFQKPFGKGLCTPPPPLWYSYCLRTSPV